MKTFMMTIVIAMSVAGCTSLQEDIDSVTYGDMKRVVLIDYCYLNPVECKVLSDMNLTHKPLPPVKCECVR